MMLIKLQDKVILSIAIIPMAQDLGLSPTFSGLVQSSFFWGYILVQLPGGYAVAKAGGRRMLPIGVALWSLATAALPVAAATAIPALCVSRAAVGLGQGLAPPSTTELIARTVPDTQRSSAVSKAFSGLHVGSVVSLLAGPALIKVALPPPPHCLCEQGTDSITAKLALCVIPP